MLRTTADSLFVSPAQTLVNTVNTVGVMGKGIALEFKKRHPTMFKRYKEFCTDGSLTVGRLQLFKTPNKWVLNFPTKKHWRGPSKVEWIESGLQRFVETYEARGITSVSFPQLGCGNGGLNWREVGPLMARYLKPLPIPVFIHMRRTPDGFVPEHEDETDVSSFSEPREQIPFERFLADVLGLFEQTYTAASTDDAEDEPPPLPVLPIANLEIRGEHLETLWYRLNQRGGLPLSEMPSAFSCVAGRVADELLKLDYIRGMTFLVQTNNEPVALRGLRLSLPARVETGPLLQSNISAHRAVLS